MQTKSLFPFPLGLLAAATMFCMPALRSEAGTCLSNLENQWTNGGIGDIHGLFPGGSPYGDDRVQFWTWAGYFSVDSVTFEFYIDSSFETPRYLDVQLFEETRDGRLLLGSFGNPAPYPPGPVWPGRTRFFDFFPTEKITLKPFSQYCLVLSVPGNSSKAAALLFTQSPVYSSPAAWTMGPTTTGNPYAAGEYLKFRVTATAEPPPDVTPPTITVSATPELLWPPTGRMIPITICGSIRDTEPGGTGINPSTAAYTVTDEYGLIEPGGSVALHPDGSYSFEIWLQSWRRGNDSDGRQYNITVTAQDQAANTGSAMTVVAVAHDRRNGGPFQRIAIPRAGAVRNPNVGPRESSSRPFAWRAAGLP